MFSCGTNVCENADSRFLSLSTMEKTYRTKNAELKQPVMSLCFSSPERDIRELNSHIGEKCRNKTVSDDRLLEQSKSKR